MHVRRKTTLLLILALLAGWTGNFAPMVMASAATAGSNDSNDHGCKGCTPAKLMVADCGAICTSLVAIVQPTASCFAGVTTALWNWNNESIRHHAIEPPTAPPRSQH